MLCYHQSHAASEVNAVIILMFIETELSISHSERLYMIIMIIL